jgi:hypothetical protein
MVLTHVFERSWFAGVFRGVELCRVSIQARCERTPGKGRSELFHLISRSGIALPTLFL